MEQSKAEELKNKAQDQISEAKEKVTEFIKENPLMSLAIAGAIGILLGKLLNSRKK